MKFSIITVAYNSGRTIADTLRSVAAQTHPDIEHLVIDGASRDDTLEQVRQHGAHVAAVVSERDRGIYDAMNKGLARASGDWVGFLNADDVLASPDSIARYARAAAGFDAIYGDLDYVAADDLGRVLRRWRSGGFARSRLAFGWMPPHPTFYVRRERLGALRFDADLRIAADYDYMLRCLMQPGLAVTYVPEVQVHMRHGGASNRSVGAMLRKSREDLTVIRRHGVGGWPTLVAKNLRKIPQFLGR